MTVWMPIARPEEHRRTSPLKEGRAANTRQHHRQHVLGHGSVACLDSVGAHQDPASQTLRQLVHAIACGGLPGLNQQRMHAAQKAMPQLRRRLRMLLQNFGFDAVPVPRDRHEASARRMRPAQDRSRAHKSVPANPAHLHGGSAGHGHHHRAHTVLQEVHGIHSSPRFVQGSIHG